MSLNKLVKNIFLNTISVAVVRVANVISIMYFSRGAKPEEFNGYTISYNLMMTIVAYSILGFGTYTVNYVSKNKNPDNRAKFIAACFSIVSLISLIACLFLALFHKLIGYGLYHKTYLSSWFLFSSILIFLYSVFNYSIAVHQAKENFKFIAKIQILFGVSTLIFQVILFHFYGMYGVMGALYITITVSILISLAKIIRSEHFIFKSSFSCDIKYFLNLIKSAFPYAISVLLVMPANNIAQIYVSRVSNDIDLSTYQISLYWQNIFMFFASAIASVLLPYINNIKEGSLSLRGMVFGLLSFNFLMILGFFIVYYISPYISSFYGGDLLVDKNFLIYPYIFFFFSANSMYLGQWLISFNLLKISVLLNSIWLVIFCLMIMLPNKLHFVDVGYHYAYVSFYIAYMIQACAIFSVVYQKMRLRNV